MNIVNVEPTPNPNSLKFNVSDMLSSNGVRQFDNHKSGQSDPLAKTLFSIEGVNAVFYASQFVTVSKTDDASWKTLENKVSETLQKFDPSQLKAGPQTGRKEGPNAPSENELLDKINQVIDENVRPPLEADGGGLAILSLDGYVLTIHYQGACGGCPSAAQGTMMAIQNLLRAMVDPRIQVVSA